MYRSDNIVLLINGRQQGRLIDKASKEILYFSFKTLGGGRGGGGGGRRGRNGGWGGRGGRKEEEGGGVKGEVERDRGEGGR